MAQERQRYALQTIFSFFLGLMVAALVGVGVNTFYPSPAERYRGQVQKLSFDQEDLGLKRSGTATLSAEDQAKLDRIRAEQRTLMEKQDAETKLWARNTSIVVILFATIVMALSLIRSEQLKVISNGLLLGGLFTMIYGTGWTIFSGDSAIRFFVLLFALGMTVALGYLKFVRGRRAERAGTPAAPIAAEEDLGELEARVSALEARAAAAAAALGGESSRE